VKYKNVKTISLTDIKETFRPKAVSNDEGSLYESIIKGDAEFALADRDYGNLTTYDGLMNLIARNSAKIAGKTIILRFSSDSVFLGGEWGLYIATERTLQSQNQTGYTRGIEETGTDRFDKKWEPQMIERGIELDQAPETTEDYKSPKPQKKPTTKRKPTKRASAFSIQQMRK